MAEQLSSGKGLDLLLVNPSARRKVYQKAQEKEDYPALEPPYLALLAAGFIRRNGYEVRILDTNVDNLSTEEAADAIKSYNPRFVHIIVHGNQPSASTQLMDEVNAICSGVRNSGLETKILLTGTHPSALPQRTLQEGFTHFVGIGEGVCTILGLLQQKPLNEVPGLGYLENGSSRINPDQAIPEENLDEVFPSAAWDLIEIQKYRAHDWHCLDGRLDKRQPYASMYTTFGCPFKCEFCCINAPYTGGGSVDPTIRCRNPKLVVDEMEMLVKEHGVENLKIIDEMFVLKKPHYLGVANEIIKRGLGDKLNIWAYARVDTVKDISALETLKKAGFNWLALGIESGSKDVRDGVVKGRFTEDDIYRNVRRVQSVGIHVVGNYIFGLSDDTEESMQATLDLALALNCERPNFYCGMAYPGSKYHAKAQQGEYPIPPGWASRPLLPEDQGGPGWIGYSQHSYQTWPLPTSSLYPEKVLEFRDSALPKFFQSSGYTALVKRKFGQKAVDTFCKVNASLPRRKLLGHLPEA